MTTTTNRNADIIERLTIDAEILENASSGICITAWPFVVKVGFGYLTTKGQDEGKVGIGSLKDAIQFNLEGADHAVRSIDDAVKVVRKTAMIEEAATIRELIALLESN